MPLQSTQQGLEAVDRVAERLHLDGVYGPLYKLFDTIDSYKTAVENIANNRFAVTLNESFHPGAD